MKKYHFCIFFLCVQLVFFGLEIRGQNPSGAIPVEYCDLIKNPEAYDGKEVTLRATYRYGFEWQEIYCLECRNLGKTWLEIWDITKKSKKILKKFPKDDGTINAIFTGIFQSSKGPFGDGGYRYRFRLKEISQAELVTKSGADPYKLPDTLRKKVCGNIELSPVTIIKRSPCHREIGAREKTGIRLAKLQFSFLGISREWGRAHFLDDSSNNHNGVRIRFRQPNTCRSTS